MLQLKLNRALAIRLALILLGFAVFVGVGFVAPDATQRELWREYWPVFGFGAALILCGCVGDW